MGQEDDRVAQRLDGQVGHKKSEIARLKGFAEEYSTLHSTLSTLPSKLRHDVMVPFSSLAFFEGQIEHTNEVLMLVGDDWFIERTTAKALETINSRRAYVDENIALLEKEIVNLEAVIEQAKAKNRKGGMNIGPDGLMEINEKFEEGSIPSTPSDMRTDRGTKKTAPSSQYVPPSKIDLAELARLEALEAAERGYSDEEEEGNEDEDEEEIICDKEDAPIILGKGTKNAQDRMPLPEPDVDDDRPFPTPKSTSSPAPMARSPSDLYQIMEEREKQRESQLQDRSFEVGEVGEKGCSSGMGISAKVALQPNVSKSVVMTSPRDRSIEIGGEDTKIVGQPAVDLSKPVVVDSTKEEKETPAPPKKVSKFKSEMQNRLR